MLGARQDLSIGLLRSLEQGTDHHPGGVQRRRRVAADRPLEREAVAPEQIESAAPGVDERHRSQQDALGELFEIERRGDRQTDLVDRLELHQTVAVLEVTASQPVAETIDLGGEGERQIERPRLRPPGRRPVHQRRAGERHSPASVEVAVELRRKVAARRRRDAGEPILALAVERGRLDAGFRGPEREKLGGDVAGFVVGDPLEQGSPVDRLRRPGGRHAWRLRRRRERLPRPRRWSCTAPGP